MFNKALDVNDIHCLFLSTLTHYVYTLYALSETLVQHLDDYIALKDTFANKSLILNKEELKESIRAAEAMQEYVQENINKGFSEIMSDNQIKITLQLQDALNKLQILPLENSEELNNDLGKDDVTRMVSISTVLKEDLENILIASQMAIQNVDPIKDETLLGTANEICSQENIKEDLEGQDKKSENILGLASMVQDTPVDELTTSPNDKIVENLTSLEEGCSNFVMSQDQSSSIVKDQEIVLSTETESKVLENIDSASSDKPFDENLDESARTVNKLYEEIEEKIESTILQAPESIDLKVVEGTEEETVNQSKTTPKEFSEEIGEFTDISGKPNIGKKYKIMISVIARLSSVVVKIKLSKTDLCRKDLITKSTLALLIKN